MLVQYSAPSTEGSNMRPCFSFFEARRGRKRKCFGQTDFTERQIVRGEVFEASIRWVCCFLADEDDDDDTECQPRFKV